ncbi:cytochrome P450, partial [Thamnocephalis sphaerospora]
LYDIAGNAEMRANLYQEQQDIIAQHGTDFTKEALQDMTFLEACLRETLRVHTNFTFSFRVAMRDVTFSNGKHIPAGRNCIVHTRSENRQPDVHTDAEVYMPERAIGPTGQHLATTPGPGYITFGMGRKICPGRFFAVGMLKVLASMLVRDYDFSTESGTRPANKTHDDGNYLPQPEPILFKK